MIYFLRGIKTGIKIDSLRNSTFTRVMMLHMQNCAMLFIHLLNKVVGRDRSLTLYCHQRGLRNNLADQLIRK